MEQEAYPQKPVDDIVSASLHDNQSSQNSFLLVWILVSLLLFAAAGFAGYYLATPKAPKTSEITPFPTLKPKPPSPTPTSSLPTPIVKDGCLVGGCNSEICYEEGKGTGISPCVAKPEFGCYRTATCEHQSNGQCGWTQTEELQSCLEQYQ